MRRVPPTRIAGAPSNRTTFAIDPHQQRITAHCQHELTLLDQEYELVFYNVQPPQGSTGPGKHIMMPNFRSENYNIYLFSEEFEALTESLEVLMPIGLSKSQ